MQNFLDGKWLLHAVWCRLWQSSRLKRGQRLDVSWISLSLKTLSRTRFWARRMRQAGESGKLLLLLHQEQRLWESPKGLWSEHSHHQVQRKRSDESVFRQADECETESATCMETCDSVVFRDLQYRALPLSEGCIVLPSFAMINNFPDYFITLRITYSFLQLRKELVIFPQFGYKIVRSFESNVQVWLYQQHWAFYFLVHGYAVLLFLWKQFTNRIQTSGGHV